MPHLANLEVYRNIQVKPLSTRIEIIVESVVLSWIHDEKAIQAEEKYIKFEISAWLSKQKIPKKR